MGDGCERQDLRGGEGNVVLVRMAGQCGVVRLNIDLKAEEQIHRQESSSGEKLQNQKYQRFSFFSSLSNPPALSP